MYANDDARDDAQCKKSVSIYIYYLPMVLTDGCSRVCVCVCVCAWSGRRLVIPTKPRQPTLVVATHNEVELVTRGKH